MPHGGFVIRSGKTGAGTGAGAGADADAGSSHTIEYSLKLDSNPEFTASVLVAYARAAVRLNRQGDVGAKTVFDIAPGLLSVKSAAELRREML
jgi:diaminopimelate dehydrogenase